jgi:ceramide kinase
MKSLLIYLAETYGWHNISGRFISVMGATNCCANKKAPEGISPSAHLADGFIDLVVVRHTSRARYLHHMIRLAGRSDHVSRLLLTSICDQ